MGSNTGSWILLGLVAVVASLASAANIQRSDGQSIYQNNGNTFLSNDAGQIIRRADGKTVLIGSDGSQIVTSDEDDSGDDSSSRGNHNSNSIIIGGGHNLISGSGNDGSYINSNGHSIRVINGALELTENGQVYTFRPKERSVTEKETVTINGQPAQVEYSNGDVIVELADHTVVAKVGDGIFSGDRNSFDNRHNISHNIQKEVQANLQKMREELKNTFDHLFD